jgi:NADPH:quinone reductase-like Zn-dependent oxidoreductase
VQTSETVLTLGTGGVSVFAAQFAKAMGARVIATSSSDEKLARLRDLGADETINYKTTPKWDKTVLDLTGGRGVDHVIEVGGSGTLTKSIKSVRTGGHIALIGALDMTGEFNPIPIFMKGIRMQGIFVGSREMFEAMNMFISEHDIRPVIDRTFEFDDLPAALHYMETGSHFGKIVINY